MFSLSGWALDTASLCLYRDMRVTLRLLQDAREHGPHSWPCPVDGEYLDMLPIPSSRSLIGGVVGQGEYTLFQCANRRPWHQIFLQRSLLSTHV